MGVHVIFLKVEIQVFDIADSSILQCEIVSDKPSEIFFRQFLDLTPVGMIIVFLLLGGKRHQKIVAYLVCLLQILTAGVQRFKYKLWVVFRLQTNVDNFQLLNSRDQVLECKITGRNQLIE